MRDLSSREGSFFVTGNHEYFVEDPPSWLRELERLGVQPLRNENTTIRRGTAAFHVAGVNDVAGASEGDPPDFDRALAGLDIEQDERAAGSEEEMPGIGAPDGILAFADRVRTWLPSAPLDGAEPLGFNLEGRV